MFSIYFKNREYEYFFIGAKKFLKKGWKIGEDGGKYFFKEVYPKKRVVI